MNVAMVTKQRIVQRRYFFNPFGMQGQGILSLTDACMCCAAGSLLQVFHQKWGRGVKVPSPVRPKTHIYIFLCIKSRTSCQPNISQQVSLVFCIFLCCTHSRLRPGPSYLNVLLNNQKNVKKKIWKCDESHHFCLRAAGGGHLTVFVPQTRKETQILHFSSSSFFFLSVICFHQFPGFFLVSDYELFG